MRTCCINVTIIVVVYMNTSQVNQDMNLHLYNAYFLMKEWDEKKNFKINIVIF